MNELLLFVYTEFKLIEELGNKDKKKKKKRLYPILFK